MTTNESILDTGTAEIDLEVEYLQKEELWLAVASRELSRPCLQLQFFHDHEAATCS